jgi:hypothetical protein
VLFVPILPPSDADLVGRFAFLQVVRTLIQGSFHQMLTKSDVSLVCSQVVRALFRNPSSHAHQVGCFAHSQAVTDLLRISLDLVLTVFCIFPTYSLYVLCFDTLFIGADQTAPCSFTGCTCFVLYLV